jgi:hypothetical protein
MRSSSFHNILRKWEQDRDGLRKGDALLEDSCGSNSKIAAPCGCWPAVDVGVEQGQSGALNSMKRMG